ncbi:hypothetical protein [Streptomyces tirandamycinicus]|uniref:Uncharacterized protein n=1 Tax=Streptomyces tirandamycinicus TaxID=2174846 RepID=A0A2S1T286_9ACTN|nr:hypothetical protein [Streptomyces tirandamycinicus]AWI32696.1 hypothetical protein DDW44_30740 [Streptomyces tirandamycinicus]
MTVYDYRPIYGGALIDPGLNGGQVSRIDLYATPDRNGTVAATAGPAVRQRSTVYRFALPDNLPDGRYWCTVTFTPGKDLPPVTDRTVKVDLPRGNGLLASAEQVADKLGVPLPLTAQQRESFRDAITDAQADVVTYLGRPVVPQPRTLLGAHALFGYDLDDAQAWPIHDLDDVVSVVSHVDNLDGTYDVQLLVGLDGAAEEPIVRYIVTHAAESIRNKPSATEGTRRVTSVSAEGQSISYEGAPAAGQAGAPPELNSLAGYRKYLYRPIPVVPAVPWPYGRGRRYSRW